MLQLSIPTGSSLTVGSGATVSVTGAVLNDGTLDNQGTVQLTGVFTSPGTLTGAAGLWKLTGSGTAQVLNVGSLVPSLEILNPQGAAPLRVRQLQLTGGGVRLGGIASPSPVGAASRAWMPRRAALWLRMGWA